MKLPSRLVRLVCRSRRGSPKLHLISWAWVITIAWTISIATYFILFADKDALRQPNSFGDFLAGAFAPVAFLWLVITSLIQSAELELQRQELQQNRRALELQAQQLENSVTQLAEQTKILSEELESSRSGAISQELSEELDAISVRIGRNWRGFKVVVRNTIDNKDMSLYLFERSSANLVTRLDELVGNKEFDEIFRYANARAAKFSEVELTSKHEVLNAAVIVSQCELIIYDLRRIIQRAEARNLKSVLIRAQVAELFEFLSTLHRCVEKLSNRSVTN